MRHTAPVRSRAARLVLASAAWCACASSAAAQGPPGPPALTDEILYQFMPIAWRDSDNDDLRYGDFNGMTASLDYLRNLGVTGVWMTPIFPSPAYHGYQHLDADKVNPRLGTEEQFLAFVAEAHARGIKVFIDLVVYGVGQESTYFQDAYNNRDSKYTPWLAFKDPQNATYQGYTYRTWNGAEVGFVHWNLNNPEPRALVTRWASHWLDPNGDGNPSDGVDGFRLDHVWAFYKEGPNGWGYTLDDFWKPWRASLEKVNPRVITFAEQAQWESTGVDLLGAFDAAFTKPIEVAARDALRTGNAEDLYRSVHTAVRDLRSTREPGRAHAGTFLGILGDHDVDRLASHIEPSGTADPLMRRPALAAVILMTLPFPPVVYMGDEIGMVGVRRKGATDANDIPVREPFKWKAVAGPPMTDYWQANRQAVEGAFSRDSDGRSVEEQEAKPGSLLETYRSLIALRKASPALRSGAYISMRSSDDSVFTFLRQEGEELVLVGVNLKEKDATVQLAVPRMVGRWNAWKLKLVGGATPAGATPPTFDAAATSAKLHLPGLGAAVYRLERAVEEEKVPGKGD